MDRIYRSLFPNLIVNPIVWPGARAARLPRHQERGPVPQDPGGARPVGGGHAPRLTPARHSTRSEIYRKWREVEEPSLFLFRGPY